MRYAKPLCQLRFVHVASLRLLAICCLLGLALSACAHFTGNEHPSTRVPKYEVFEIVLTSKKNYSQPFAEVTVSATFTAPSGRQLRAFGFYDGDNVWRIRLAPDETGEWSYAVDSDDPDNAAFRTRGKLDCVPSKRHGFIRADPVRKYWFSFDDGSPFFGVGDTAYGLTNGINDEQRGAYLTRRAAQRFNFIRFFVAGFPLEKHATLETESAWPWAGTPDHPDYDALNPRYFQRLDSIMKQLEAHGLHAEMEVFNGYSAPFNEPDLWTPARRDLWVRYVIARYAAYPTVFLWTVTNEYETYPDGKYRYDGAVDDDWAKAMGALFHAYDPYKHPTTVHNFSFDADGGIGGRFGASIDIDVLTQQAWGDAQWNGRYRDGDAAGIERAIWTDRIYGKPVINTENGYEWLSGYPTTYNEQVVGTDKARRAAWRIFTAGGAAYAAGFAGTWRTGDDYLWDNQGPLFLRLEDMGLAEQLKHYRSFVEHTNFRELSPAQDLVDAPHLCLTDRSREFVIYAPRGGSVRLDLTKVSKKFAAQWFDPRAGNYRRLADVAGGSMRNFAAPDEQDWVLYLKAR